MMGVAKTTDKLTDKMKQYTVSFLCQFVATLFNNGEHYHDSQESKESSSCHKGDVPHGQLDAVNQQNNLSGYKQQNRDDVDIENNFDSVQRPQCKQQRRRRKKQRHHKKQRRCKQQRHCKQQGCDTSEEPEMMHDAVLFVSELPRLSPVDWSLFFKLQADIPSWPWSWPKRSILSRGKESNYSMLDNHAHKMPSPRPITPASITPASITPASITPASITPASITPAPIRPITPSHITPAPVRKVSRHATTASGGSQCLLFGWVVKILLCLTILNMPGVMVGVQGLSSASNKTCRFPGGKQDLDLYEYSTDMSYTVQLGLQGLALAFFWVSSLLLACGCADTFNSGLGAHMTLSPRAIAVPDDIPYPTDVFGPDNARIPSDPTLSTPADTYDAFFDPCLPVECDDRPTASPHPRDKARELAADGVKHSVMIITPGSILKLNSVDSAVVGIEGNAFEGRLQDQLDCPPKEIGYVVGGARGESCLLGEVLPQSDSRDTVEESKEDAQKRQHHTQEQAHEQLLAQASPEGHLLPSAFVCPKWTINFADQHGGVSTFAPNPRWVTELVVPHTTPVDNNVTVPPMECQDRQGRGVMVVGCVADHFYPLGQYKVLDPPNNDAAPPAAPGPGLGEGEEEEGEEERRRRKRECYPSIMDQPSLRVFHSMAAPGDD